MNFQYIYLSLNLFWICITKLMSCGRPSRQCQLSSELLTEPRIPLEWVAAFSFQERIGLASILLLQSCIMIMSYLPFWFVSLIRYLENLERHGGTSFGTETLLKGHFRLSVLIGLCVQCFLLGFDFFATSFPDFEL